MNEREGLDVHAQHRQHNQEQRKCKIVIKKKRERREMTHRKTGN